VGHRRKHLREYVRVACGADPRLFPTLLGLRLMNDPMVRLRLASSTPAVLPFQQTFDFCGSCAFTPACMPLFAALVLSFLVHTA
jgi:hypothetical protein